MTVNGKRKLSKSGSVQHMLYLLAAGATVDLRDEFTSDGIIIFRSPTLDFISEDTSIDLHNSNGDIVLRIAFHPGILFV